MEDLITIQVTDDQLAALQVLVAESIADVNGLDQALAVPIPAAAGDCTDCYSVQGYLRWREGWKESRWLCDRCFKKRALAEGCDPEPDPAVAQLQRAVKQEGIRLWALEQQVGTFASHTDVDRLRKALASYFCLSGGERERLAATEARTAALETIHADGTREDGGIGHGFLTLPVEDELARVSRLENQSPKTTGHIAALEELVFANHSDTEKRIAALEGDKRNAPWLEVWGSNPSAAPNLYSALMVADALGLPYDYVREKMARHCGDDEPDEVAEPVDSPYRHPDGDPKYDLDT